MEETIVKEELHELDMIFKRETISDSNLDEADLFLNSVRVSVHSIREQSIKSKYIAQIKIFSDLLDKYRRDQLVKIDKPDAQESIEIDKQDPRTKQLDILKGSLKKLHECEEDGKNAMRNLEDQKDKIKNIKQNVAKTNAGLGLASKMLSRMQKWWRG